MRHCGLALLALTATAALACESKTIVEPLRCVAPSGGAQVEVGAYRFSLLQIDRVDLSVADTPADPTGLLWRVPNAFPSTTQLRVVSVRVTRSAFFDGIGVPGATVAASVRGGMLARHAAGTVAWDDGTTLTTDSAGIARLQLAFMGDSALTDIHAYVGQTEVQKSPLAVCVR